jgi:hypothetical protein
VTEQQLPLRFGGGRYDQRPPVTRLFYDPASLSRPLSGIEGVTAHVARRLRTFGLETVGDLVEHFPRRYEDFRDRKAIRDLKVGEEATIRGEVVRVRAERTARRRVDIVKVLLRDDTGAVEAVWFNQKYLTKGPSGRRAGGSSSWSRVTRSSRRGTGTASTPKAWCRSIPPASRCRPSCCGRWCTGWRR